MSKTQPTDEQLIHYFYNTDLGFREISKIIGRNYHGLFNDLKRLIPEEDRKLRRSKNWAKPKMGSKNPMYGKHRESHHNFVGDVSDNKGYRLRLKPEWYTGRKRSKHIFAHHLVICEELGITEVPKGWHVHHIDGDKENNNINNLALLTSGAHTRLHGIERGWKIKRCNDYPEGE